MDVKHAHAKRIASSAFAGAVSPTLLYSWYPCCGTRREASERERLSKY